MIMQRLPPRLVPVVTTASASAPTSARAATGASRSRMLWPRVAAALLAAAAAASLGYWALRLFPGGASSPAPAPGAAASLPAAADPDQVARLLGSSAAPKADAPAAHAAARLVLTGVAAGASGRGSALIAVDGQAPKPYAVGVTVAEGLVLQSVQGRKAMLGPSPRGPSSLVLELPPLPR